MIWPMRASFSTIELPNLLFAADLPTEFRRRHVGLMHLHEVDAHEERIVRMRVLVEIVERGLLDIFVKERDADDALVRRVDILPVDLEVLVRRLAGLARKRALGDPVEHVAQFRVHVREPGRIAVGVGVQVVEADVTHLVEALRIGKRVVGLAQVPLAGEERGVAAELQNRAQRPLRGGQPAALTLEGDRGHAAPVRNASRDHRRASRGAGGLAVEGQELHALGGDAVEVRCRRAAVVAAAVGAHVAVAEVVGYDHDDIGLRDLRGRRADRERQRRRERRERQKGSSGSPHCVLSFRSVQAPRA